MAEDKFTDYPKFIGWATCDLCGAKARRELPDDSGVDAVEVEALQEVDDRVHDGLAPRGIVRHPGEALGERPAADGPRLLGPSGAPIWRLPTSRASRSY